MCNMLKNASTKSKMQSKKDDLDGPKKTPKTKLSVMPKRYDSYTEDIELSQPRLFL